MTDEALEKWKQIYQFAMEIASREPWEWAAEEDIITLVPKGEKEEHFFSFLGQNSDRYGIAIYHSTDAYAHARERLYGPNPKNEPVFLLQDAIILFWGDRADVSKENYALIKALGLKCRGQGGWPFFERYRVGYVPQPVPEEELDTLLDDLGNLMMMVVAVDEKGLKVDFQNRQALARFYSEKDDMFYTFAANFGAAPKPRYVRVGVGDGQWLRSFRAMPSKGTIALDWSYLPTRVKNGKTDIIPRLLLAVDARSGYVMKSQLIAEPDKPYEALLSVLVDIGEEYGRPSGIEICDPEIEAYLSDLCKKAGIRLVMRKQIKQITRLRKDMISDLLEMD